MSEWQDKAIVLRMGLFRESDIWLRMLLQNHGLCSIFAFGGAISKRRFCGCLDVFNILDCRVKTSGRHSYLNLQEASLLDGTRNLRHNWRNMGIGANCLRFLDAIAINAESAGECFAILQNLRLCLESPSPLHRLFPLFFRLRVAAALGMSPSLSQCGNCGSSLGGGSFLANEGRVFCGDCYQTAPYESQKYSIPVTGSSLAALKHVQKNLPEKWLDISLTTREAAICARVIDAFVQYHLGLAWDKGYFKRV